jgi:hypothetical protein
MIVGLAGTTLTSVALAAFSILEGSMFIGSSNELGGFESGLVARFFGPVVSVVSGGLGTLGVVALWSHLFPGLRRFDRLTEGGEG